MTLAFILKCQEKQETYWKEFQFDFKSVAWMDKLKFLPTMSGQKIPIDFRKKAVWRPF